MEYYINSVSFFAPDSPSVPIPNPTLLAPRELRRLTPIAKMALAVAEQTLGNYQYKHDVSTVFASSHGDVNILIDNCDALADDEKMLSPTKFSHSLLNSVAGVWSIASKSQQRSISLSSLQYSAGVGVLEALMQSSFTQKPVLLLCYDIKTPTPIDEVYSISRSMACGLLLTPQPLASNIAKLDYQLCRRDSALEPRCTEENQAASLLPLLQNLHAKSQYHFDISEYNYLSLDVTPC